VKQWSYKLFTGGDLSDFLLDRWERFRAELAALELRESRGLIAQELVAELERKHRIITPVIMDQTFRICEHGVIELDRDVESMPATRHKTALKGRMAYAVVGVRFQGEPELFQLKSFDCKLDPPQGKTVGNELQLRYSRVGDTGSNWVAEFRKDLMKVENFLGIAAQRVENYNMALSRTSNPSAPQGSGQKIPASTRYYSPIGSLNRVVP
jgi:hypothetical protein